MKIQLIIVCLIVLINCYNVFSQFGGIGGVKTEEQALDIFKKCMSRSKDKLQKTLCTTRVEAQTIGYCKYVYNFRNVGQ